LVEPELIFGGYFRLNIEAAMTTGKEKLNNNNYYYYKKIITIFKKKITNFGWFCPNCPESESQIHFSGQFKTVQNIKPSGRNSKRFFAISRRFEIVQNS
jgi:hypothetical protein